MGTKGTERRCLLNAVPRTNPAQSSPQTLQGDRRAPGVGLGAGQARAPGGGNCGGRRSLHGGLDTALVREPESTGSAGHQVRVSMGVSPLALGVKSPPAAPEQHGPAPSTWLRMVGVQGVEKPLSPHPVGKQQRGLAPARDRGLGGG